MYRFTLRYTKRMPRHNLFKKNPLLACDRLFLQPAGYTAKNQAEDDHLQNMKQSTATRRIASATCVQFREVVLEMFPDTLTFRCFPPSWGFQADHVRYDNPNGSGYPERILRFNGANNIVIFHADWQGQESAVEIARLKGSPLDDFLRIRNVGLSVDSLRRQASYLPQDWNPRDCTCATPECRDHCIEEPLPRFLALFPLLERFYIAGVPTSSTHESGDSVQSEDEPSADVNCPCPKEGLKHSWPMIRSSDACGWFVVYDERSPCPFPKFGRIEELRRLWRPHFPYYRAFDHLEIRFIQLWDSERPASSPLYNNCIFAL